MSIKELKAMDTDYLSDSYKTANGIGLCYFDLEDEVLKEFSSSVVLPVLPSEKVKRQFYIVKDDPSLLYNSISILCKSTSSHYIVKSSTNREDNFDQIEADNITIAYFSNYNNIVPITIEITNTKETVVDVNLSIELEVM